MYRVGLAIQLSAILHKRTTAVLKAKLNANLPLG